MSKKILKVKDYLLDDSSSTCTCAGGYFSDLNQITILGSSNGTAQLYSSIKTDQSTKFYTGQNGEIYCLEILRESRSLLLGNSRGSIFLFDVLSQKQTEVFARHSAAVLCLQAIGTNTFISGSLDTTIRIWDDRQKAEAIVLKGHNGAVLSVNVSPDDQWVASGSEDGTVRIWDLSSVKILNIFPGFEQKSICCLAFNPEEIQLAVGGVARKTVFYDLEQFCEIDSAPLTPSTIMSMSFDGQGKSLYVAGAGFLRIINSKKPSEFTVIDANWKFPQKLLFSKQGDIFGIARNNQSASLYQIVNNQSLSNKDLPSYIAPTDELEEVTNVRRSHVKISEILDKKVNDISNIIGVWLNSHNQRNAYSAIEKITDPKVITDIFNMILNNNMIQNISVEIATLFLKKIYIIFEVKYKFFIKLGLEFSTEVLKKFGPEIKHLKTFHSNDKVDLTREERIKVYEFLLDDFQAITKNSIFSKLRIQYKNEEIGRLANNYVIELNNILDSIRKKED